MKSSTLFSFLQIIYFIQCYEKNCPKKHQVYYDPAEPDTTCLLGCKAVICHPNEHIKCGQKICTDICSTSRDPLCYSHRFDCDYHCFCKPGFVRVLKSVCIPVELCPQVLWLELHEKESRTEGL
ncbi:CLUMA_CG018255, isoform A [Clunio marinus]|uniref:CLUMA_CG018255, isoform A n=1 Tax=Clunio marinus TaxID=568069 RepID=A0A1J1IZB5_9DIPT|nr:CLUMA_CG018255, isoform A [Clunio marinus]